MQETQFMIRPTATAPPPPVIIQIPPFGPETAAITCPHCGSHVSTRVEKEPTRRTHMIAFMFCILIVTSPCAPCPYCIDGCLGKKHYCPACNAFLGEFSQL